MEKELIDSALLDLSIYPIVDERVKTRPLLLFNSLKKNSKIIARKNAIDYSEYLFTMNAEYEVFFKVDNTENRRFNRLLNNTSQPNSHELIFFAHYMNLKIDDLVEQPEWKK